MVELGLSSRREADALILSGGVLVDGLVERTLGRQVSLAQSVALAEWATAAQKRAKTVLLHKPAGFVSVRKEKNQTPAHALITRAARVLHPGEEVEFADQHIELDASLLGVCGRLDKSSRGLLVLTDDGNVARRLIGPLKEDCVGNDDNQATAIAKEYRVTFKSFQSLKSANSNAFPLPLEALAAFRAGGLTLPGDPRPLLPVQIDFVDNNKNNNCLRIVLHEGRNRQIRRMLGLFGCQVTDLYRVRIGNIHIDGLLPGQWRYLRKDETF
ncbi:hypothetical protein HK100_008638 [Physocladia obscura]|uniref:Pseudouridine synthase RsuA/RluA-like domain-containing protein n=1 Tax=Physocladia obscura TaxID=109957 RepID=A0AAD5SPF9_9FUNG|nr:hypothetical protein HK100_008638 [Physocladia obscura]